jgi:hypothetical protein
MKKMIITGFLLLTAGFRRSESFLCMGIFIGLNSDPINNAPILIRGMSYGTLFTDYRLTGSGVSAYLTLFLTEGT